MIDSSLLQLIWLDYNSSAEAIRAIRKEVFVEEQGIGEFVTDSPRDSNGLHLGLFDSGKLVSVISLFVLKSNDEFIQALQLPISEGIWIQFSRRAELREYRSRKFASLMVAHAVKSVCELFQPQGIFATLMGVHMTLKDMYMKMYGFHDVKSVELADGEALIISMFDPDVIQKLVLNVRTESLNLSRLHNLELPDLAHHIEVNPNLAENYQLKADMTNRYLQPLALEDELPRLSAQARMLFLTQEQVWNRIFEQNEEIKSIIDLGCGPGVYLSNVSRMPQCVDKTFYGLDIAEQFITYATFAHPKVNWILGNVYETKLETESLDLVHASFLFIHLLKPYLALKEIYRVLRFGGILYISDVNDATFEGPEPLKLMVKKHGEIYEGNREIMLDINFLAEQAQFELIEEYDIVVTNSGSDSNPQFKDGTLYLGKWTMWAMFSFMGQRAEVSAEYNTAEQYYMTHHESISIQIQSKIYKKP